jgi:hypothetical protein
MPVPTLVSTPGAVNANSYATVAEADAYHDSRLFATDWANADAGKKTVALIMATRLLDSLYDWTGAITSGNQALLWPRVGMWRRTGAGHAAFNPAVGWYGESAYAIASDAIPQELKNATAEFARQLIAADRSADSDIETQGIKSLKAGPVALEFKGDVVPKVVPDAVYHLIPEAWGCARGRASMTQRLVRA